MRILLLVLGVMLLLVPQILAQSPVLGVGASGGMNIPIVQEDQSSGLVFEFRARVKSLSWLVLEPKLSFIKNGDPDSDDFTFDIAGSKITAYGADVVLGGGMGLTGFRPFFVAGIGFYSVGNDDTEVAFEVGTDFGWSAGFGFDFGFSPNMGLDIRGKLHVISAEGDATRKSAAITGGLNYYFGGK
jgi:opacity protein-like surface antigen